MTDSEWNRMTDETVVTPEDVPGESLIILRPSGVTFDTPTGDSRVLIVLTWGHLTPGPAVRYAWRDPNQSVQTAIIT